VGGERLILFCLALALAPAASADVLTIRSGYTIATSGYGPMVLEKKEVLAQFGKSYVLEPAHFRSTALELSALAAGEVDIISIAYSTFALAVLNARMDDIRIIADGGQDGVGTHRTVPFLVRNDGGVAQVEDLRGKAVATNGAGGAYDVAMRWMLHRHGLEDRRDYSTVETDYATMVPMLLGGKVDLIMGAEPFADAPAIRAGAHPLFTTRDAIGPSQMTVMAARAGFLDRNRAALGDFFADMLASFRWFHDPAHRDEAIAIMARVTRQPVENFASYAFTDSDFYRDPELRPNLDSLQRNIGIMNTLGLVKGEVEVSRYADLSFVDEAGRRLK
jgi:NitT/TauT family transport system substrate-binding protein